MNKNLKCSIITVVWNNQNTIKDAIESVLGQTYPNIEYIIVDGNSTDGTIEIIESYGKKIDKFISEPDKGLYDAMNKGISMASGDIIGFLNSDDFFYNKDIVNTIVEAFKTYDIDCLFGDLVYVKPDNIDKIVRYYSSKNFSLSKFKFGYMPAHPTFYCKRDIYEKAGVFETDYKIAGDYEILLRFLKVHKIKYKYVPELFVKMRTGGLSTSGVKSNWVLNLEILRAYKKHGFKTNLFNIYLKYLFKTFEFVKRSK